MNFEDWLLMGIETGYCSEPVCGMHDAFPMSPDEQADFDDGGDPCIPIVRLFAEAL